MKKNEIINDISGMKDEGLSFAQIADRLNSEKIPTFSGKGEWNKGTVHRLLKSLKGGNVVKERKTVQKSLPDQNPAEDKTRIKRLESAYNESLKTIDRLNREISGLRQKNDSEKSEKERMNKELLQLRQKGITDVNDIIKPLADEISSLRQELHSMKSELSDNYAVVKTVERKHPNVDGWTVMPSKSDGFFRAYRTMGGKQRSVYIGKNPKDARKKIAAALEKNREKWSIVPEPVPDPDIPEKNPESLFKEILFSLNPKGRFVPVWKVRREFEKSSPAGFDAAVGSLAEKQIIEIHTGGAGGNLSEDEIRGAYYDEDKNRYLTVSWVKNTL